MIDRRLAVYVLVASLSVTACRRTPPPAPEPSEAPPAAAAPTDDDAARRAAEEAARREAEELARRTEAARATLEEMVFFDFDMSEIRPDAERVLRQKVEILQASPAVRLRIEGHADERGSTEYNLALGTRRAESVRQFFTNFGLAQDRFAVTSYGEERPLVPESNESAWARNRRAEFVITDGANQIQVPVTDR